MPPYIVFASLVARLGPTLPLLLDLTTDIRAPIANAQEKVLRTTLPIFAPRCFCFLHEQCVELLETISGCAQGCGGSVLYDPPLR